MLGTGLLLAWYDPGLGVMWLHVLVVANALVVFVRLAEIFGEMKSSEPVLVAQRQPPAPVKADTVKEESPLWLREYESMSYWKILERE